MNKKMIKHIILLCMIISLTQKETFSQEKTINAHYNEIGIDNNSIDNIESILLENGIEQNNLELAKQCILDIIKNIPEEGNEFKLDLEQKNHLIKDLGIKPSQIETLKRIALRINRRY